MPRFKIGNGSNSAPVNSVANIKVLPCVWPSDPTSITLSSGESFKFRTFPLIALVTFIR